MADPIVLKWEEEGAAALLLVLNRIAEQLDDVGKEVDDTDKKTRKFDKTTKGLGSQARKTSRAMRAFGDAFSGVNAGAGRATRTAGRLLSVFSNISAAGGPLGIATAGAAAGFFAVAGASALAAKNLVEIAANGRKVAEELKPFSEAGFFAAISPAELAQFDRVGASFDAIKTASKGAGLALANEFAPEIERGATLVVALGLAFADSVDDIGRFIRGVGGAASTLGNFIQGLGPLARGGLLAVTGGLSEAVVAAGEFADGLEDTEGAAGDYINRAKDLIGTQTRVNRALKDGTDIFADWDAVTAATNAQFQAFSDTLPEIVVRTNQINQAAQKQIESLRATAAQYPKNAALQEETALAILAIEERINRDIDAAREEISQRQRDRLQADYEVGARNLEALAALADQYRASQIQGASDTLNAISSLAATTSDVLAREGAKGAIALFRINQAAALANIGVLTAEAIVRGLASPTPILSATAAGLAGAAQAAAVAAQQPPQVQAHSGMASAMGGGQARTSGSQPDPTERDVRILQSEAVIGPEAVSMLAKLFNSQRVPAGGGAVARAFIGRETLDRGMTRNLQGGTSQFSRTVKQKSRAYNRGVGRG